MKFEEIFNQDGLYVADSFAKGVCFRIVDGTLNLVTYKDKSDISPSIDTIAVYKGLFEKTYRKVFTRQELFK